MSGGAPQGGRDAVEWLYGRNVVKLALAAGARRRAYRLAATCRPSRRLAGLVPDRLPVDTVTAADLDELLGSREHQGVALQVDGFPYADPERAAQRRPAGRAG